MQNTTTNIYNIFEDNKTVKYITKTKNYKINGMLIFQLKFKRAKLLAKSKVAKKINKYLEKKQTALTNKYLKKAKKYYYKGRTEFPHTLSSTIKLTYNKEGKYSFKMEYSGYSGGASCYGGVNGFTFKKANGKKISALSVIKNKKTFLKNIKKAFKKEHNNIYNRDIKKRKLKDYMYCLKGKYVLVMYNTHNAFMYNEVKVNRC